MVNAENPPQHRSCPMPAAVVAGNCRRHRLTRQQEARQLAAKFQFLILKQPEQGLQVRTIMPMDVQTDGIPMRKHVIKAIRGKSIDLQSMAEGRAHGCGHGASDYWELCRFACRLIIELTNAGQIARD